MLYVRCEERKSTIRKLELFVGLPRVMCCCCRFQDVEEESNVDLETTNEETNREQNNNSMFQQNLEIPQDNSMINAR